MKEEISHKNPENHDEKECFVNSASSQNENTCPSAAAGEPADGQVVNCFPEEIFPVTDSRESMAESVTRHALITRPLGFTYCSGGNTSHR